MKRIVVLLLVAVFASGALMAQEKSDEGIGLSIGVELIIPDFEYADEFIIVRPFVDFEKSFDALDLYAGLGVPIAPIEDEMLVGIDFNLEGTYNLEIGDSSLLTFTVGTWMYLPFDNDKGMCTDYMYFGTGPGWAATEGGWSSGFGMHLNVGAGFTQTLDAGDLYFNINMPFNLISPSVSSWVDDPLLGGKFVDTSVNIFDVAELQFTVGMDLESGFGFGAVFYGWIGDSDAGDFVQNMDVFLSFETEPVFFGLTFGLPLYEDGFKYEGLTITPEVEFGFDFGLTVFAGVPIYGVGSEDGIFAGLYVGAKFSF